MTKMQKHAVFWMMMAVLFFVIIFILQGMLLPFVLAFALAFAVGFTTLGNSLDLSFSSPSHESSSVP